MELAYIWVEDYKIIKRTGFNFCNSQGTQFSYDGNALKVKVLPKPILNFGPNILSVTAIAGQNGSGKSSLCEVIIHSIATLVNGSMGYNLRFKGIICIGQYVFKQESLNINNEDELINHGLTVRTFVESPLEDMNAFRKLPLLDLGFIYYSNVIDWRSGFDEMNLANISTLNLLFDNIYKSPYFYFTSRHDLPTEDHFRSYNQKTSLQAFHLEENHRFVKFILHCEDFLPFNKPESYEIFISHSDENRWINMHNVDTEIKIIYSDIDIQLRNNIYTQTVTGPDEVSEQTLSREQFVKCILYLYRFNLAQHFAVQGSKYLEFEPLSKFVFEGVIPTVYESITEALVPLLASFDKLLAASTMGLNFKPGSMNMIYSRTDWRLEFIQHFNLSNTALNNQLLSKFLMLEEQLLRDENRTLLRLSSCVLSPYPSAGQNSFLALFSRLYDTITNYTQGYDTRKNLIVFIDEGDMAFHPDWKKRLLLWLKDFFNKEFQPFKIQLFMTSHSPYLLSDLHAENIILLKKGSNGNTQVVDSNSNRTFGANIHELLADSFYMHDGFIGVYAQETLENLVSFLQSNDNETEEWNKERARSVIRIVADDIIRLRLEDLFEEKFDETMKSLLEEKEQLESRLKEINKELKNDTRK